MNRRRTHDEVKEVLERMGEANVCPNLEKCTSAAESIEWVRHKLTQEGVEPISSNVHGNSERLLPKTLKQLRSFLHAVNEFNKFVAKFYFLVRTLSKKDTEWNWTEETRKAFEKIKIRKRNSNNSL